MQIGILNSRLSRRNNIGPLQARQVCSMIYSGFCIIKIRLIRLMLGSKVWTVERPKMWTFYIFDPLKTDTYERNISLIRLMLIKQNPE